MTSWKNLILTAVLFVGIGHAAHCQQARHFDDTAARVVQHYLDLLNHDALPSDTMLHIVSYIYTADAPHDTIVLERWYVPELRFRYEMRHGDTLLESCYSNGIDKYRYYPPDSRKWQDLSMSNYFRVVSGYDVRGPLYNYRSNDSELFFAGVWKYKEQDVYRIRIQEPNRYDRFYLFEKESGLLFFIDELDTHDPEMVVTSDDTHIDWRAYHEYLPLGRCIFPSIESFQYNNTIVYLFHHPELIKIDNNIFNKDLRR